MNITYNNIGNSNNILTFSDVPNILKMKQTFSGRKGVFSFNFYSGLSNTVSVDGQYYVTFMDETITNVVNPSNAVNKRFFISSDPNSTAASFANALRNCASLVAQFDVEHDGNEVELQAKEIGKTWTLQTNYYSTNISNQYLTASGNDGTASPADAFQCKAQVDVFKKESDSFKYVTTLTKNFYGNECAFNVSPVLSTFSEFGKAIDYKFKLSTIQMYGNDAGKYQDRGSFTGKTTFGYLANQSDKFKLLGTTEIALNNNRNQVRYAYGQMIPFSVVGSGNTSVECVVKNSVLSALTTSTVSVSIGSNGIADSSYTIPLSVYNDAAYVDMTVNNKTWRFKIIKPLKATEYYQRILWRNEYGGIEFFDFTAKRSETDSVDIETYEKSIFDFYSNPAYELKKIYSNDYKKTVKVSSHLLEADGRWFANSLMRSKKVWTVVNNKTHYIIPKSVTVDEDGTYNNIYTVELTYEYSQLS